MCNYNATADITLVLCILESYLTYDSEKTTLSTYRHIFIHLLQCFEKSDLKERSCGIQVWLHASTVHAYMQIRAFCVKTLDAVINVRTLSFIQLSASFASLPQTHVLTLPTYIRPSFLLPNLQICLDLSLCVKSRQRQPLLYRTFNVLKQFFLVKPEKNITILSYFKYFNYK